MSASVLTTDEVRARLAALLPELRERYGVRSLALFGSYARGEQTPESDVDVLVEFERTPTLYTLGGLLLDLKDVLGTSVDLVMPESLKPAMGRNVDRDRLPVA
jgi:uncharacterized protein